MEEVTVAILSTCSSNLFNISSAAVTLNIYSVLHVTSVSFNVSLNAKIPAGTLEEANVNLHGAGAPPIWSLTSVKLAGSPAFHVDCPSVEYSAVSVTSV